MTLVRDIWPGGASAHAHAARFTDVDGTVFFVADDGIHGGLEQ